MMTRRGFASCALCALTGLAAPTLRAEMPQPAGLRRRILQRIEGPTPDFETIIALAEIEPGFHVPRHIHPGIESAYIVEGGAVLSVNGLEDRAVQAGDTLQVAARTPHQLQNGDKPMRIVSTYILEKGQPISLPA
ncbi:cupin domain-containing protein [uncultured Rhodoblastus sp.]|uniref:cupin domain-containing protein n=1 Tax=uncultured Rhodoblastus sp. TaxID=543037 RepID=UPI0025CB8BAD|nr:cupin domain-containing protein [uncultured Rhodoblastus sp.]